MHCLLAGQAGLLFENLTDAGLFSASIGNLWLELTTHNPRTPNRRFLLLAPKINNLHTLWRVERTQVLYFDIDHQKQGGRVKRISQPVDLLQRSLLATYHSPLTTLVSQSYARGVT
jgi:hypothetical protein